MLDDLNENKDNLTEDTTPQEGEITPTLSDDTSGEEINSATPVEEISSTIETETTPAVNDGEVDNERQNDEETDNDTVLQTAEETGAEADASAAEETGSADETGAEADTLTETDTSAEADTSAARGEDSNSISADLIRGHINTIILRALYERDKYGYEIINDIESKSHGQYTLKQPTLYSALKRLENQGYIKAYWKTDEVTLGGRRKYFKLTESGKAITEKNLSEWEYSRTIIDSLISDKSFDFAKPAPTAVDFSLLRDSVSRVPTVNVDEKAEEYARQIAQSQESIRELTEQQQLLEQQILQQQADLQAMQEKAEQERIRIEEEAAARRIKLEEEAAQALAEQQAAQALAQQQAEQLAQEQARLAELQAAQEKAAQALAEQQAAQALAQQQAAQAAQAEQEAQEAEARRRTHENYMRLVSEPVHQKPVQAEDIVPGSDNTNTDKLLYNNRPETERDYRNLIDGIFFKTVYHGSVQTTYHTRRSDGTHVPQPRGTADQTAGDTRLKDRAASDGVRITSSNERNSVKASKTTYNKGLTLLKSSAVVLAILIIEAILCYVFMDKLAINWVYPAAILAIGVVQFSIFAVMAISGYGKRTVLPTSHGYVSGCIIISILLVLIIAATAFLLNINMSVISDILKMLVIPSATALNLTVFGICFRLFIK